MKKTALTIFTFLFYGQLSSQQESPVLPGNKVEQQLENLAEQQDADPEDDSYLQALVQLKKNRLDLNTAEENDLKELKILSGLQILNFLQYRKLLGSLIDVHELQAVPGWDVATIEKILPYVQVRLFGPFENYRKQKLTAGQHSLMLRMQQVLEKSNGFIRPDSVAIRYPGSAKRIFFRYKYQFRNLFQFGIAGEKDPGEEFFRGKQSLGFDFYSYHFFAKKLGPVKSLALGDFTVNLGQGLIHWQSMAFKKSSDISAIKRQASVLRPYNSSGEYNFMRGAGFTVEIKNINITAFGSVRSLDGSLNSDTAQNNDDYISAIQNSGYHRTATEVAKKNALSQNSFGGNISFTNNNLHIGLNGIAFKFSVPFIRNIFPYNQYAVQGQKWVNFSIDYSYTYRNLHFFGETAIDKNHSKAFLVGLLTSLDPKVDLSVVYRNIEKSYQTLYGNAFTESSYPTNENGLFTGISLKPTSFLKIDAYADVFSFPWLRYRVDAPTTGREYLLQLSYNPDKLIEIYTRFKNSNKATNLSGTGLPARPVYLIARESWRTQVSYILSRHFSMKQRVELMWFDPREKERRQQGFLIYSEGSYKRSPVFTFNARLQYFETDGFDSRLYSFESDVLYSYSIPQFAGKGVRYYINIVFDLSRAMTIWCRWAQTVYANQNSIGTGLDKIEGNKKSEIKFQILYNF